MPKPDIGRKSRNGVPVGILSTFGIEKLEWCGYPMVKKIEDMFIRFDFRQNKLHERDGETDW